MIPARDAFTAREWQLIRLLNTPRRVQHWLNELPYNNETKGETLVRFAVSCARAARTASRGRWPRP